ASSQLIVIGYSDRHGSLLLNRRVSQARAEAIAKRLIALGIPKQKILAIGRAQQNPLATEFGQESNNRRVEFEVRYLRKGDAVP
ncbi:MAG: OmpA family protein, partial [Gammaproteobacteria bacterium]|nr:OmpA family protein [Gammaproteobacteria bacterium]